MSKYEQYKRWSNNAAKLADVLRDLPDEQHNQSLWGMQGHSCGTVGCAMGWAAMSRQFLDQGLDFKFSDKDPLMAALRSVYNAEKGLTFIYKGKENNLSAAIHDLFGPEIRADVFLNTYRSKQATIDRLMRYAEAHCSRAKLLKDSEK